jgi:hypothetical protein
VLKNGQFDTESDQDGLDNCLPIVSGARVCLDNGRGGWAQISVQVYSLLMFSLVYLFDL